MRDASRYARVGELFERARVIPADQRTALLDRECSDDVELRAEVDRLLAYHERGGDVFDGEVPPALIAGSAADAPGGDPAPRIGGFEILDTLGEGGMAIVYLAEQARPRRRVAIKVIKPGLVSRRTIRRFEFEAETLGRLSHPGIARVFEAGMFDDGSGGRPYIAMELVDGEPLTEYALRRNLTVADRLRLFLEIINAVAHAHQRGILHRDLKPGNVLITESVGPRSGEPGRQPKILDFGIARAVSPETQITTLETIPGEIVGTLAYMSPEQIEGESNIDIRADVYSLGVMLYELLTNELPYMIRDKTLARAIRIMTESNPVPLDSVERGLRGDVTTIVHKALERDRARRYQSAHTFAEDIRRFLNHEPITARPNTTIYRISRFTRRNKALVAGSGLAIIALLAGTVGTTLGMISARDEAARARAVNDFMESILSQPAPDRAGSDVRLVDVLTGATEEIDSRFATHPEERMRVYQMLGRGLRNVSQFEEAVAATRRAADIALDEYGPADERTILARAMLADHLRGASRFREAAATAQEVLDLLPARDRTASEIALNARRIIANEKMTRRAYRAAEADLRSIVEDAVRAFGPDHSAAISAQITLASLLCNRASEEYSDSAESDLAEAAEIFAAHLDRYEASGRSAGMNELTTHILLASALLNLGRSDESEQVLGRFDRAAAGRLGPDHGLRADALEARGRIHASRGEREEAATCIIDAVEIHRGRSGDRDPMTLSSMGDGLAIIESGGAFERGEEYARLLASVMASHGGVQRYQLFLARFISAQGRVEEADAIFKSLEEDADIASTPALGCLYALFLGEHELALGHTEEAAALFERAESLRAASAHTFVLPSSERVLRSMRAVQR